MFYNYSTLSVDDLDDQVADVLEYFWINIIVITYDMDKVQLNTSIKFVVVYSHVKNPWPNVDAHSGVLLNIYDLTEASILCWTSVRKRTAGEWVNQISASYMERRGESTRHEHCET
ncbi:hypothetical protein L1987_78462 [Smallanthus sonchifolius]|uniref:Uncharacterized protein n=1 Tax=Smallanthus sonchifolius TaxID=185202 RepID=A0ACB8ZCR4_9ASTR|nr:hypothetical protein L1987_78462 [Smallanthus sonchifolius]